jgi:hypothetical protein
MNSGEGYYFSGNGQPVFVVMEVSGVVNTPMIQTTITPDETRRPCFHLPTTRAATASIAN